MKEFLKEKGGQVLFVVGFLILGSMIYRYKMAELEIHARKELATIECKENASDVARDIRKILLKLK